MVDQTKLNTGLIAFVCAFGVSFGVLVLLGLAYAPMDVRAPIFTIGVLVLSYFFYHLKDIRLILVYSLGALGILFLLFPMFMYLGIPKAFPEYEIKISGEQAALIGISTGASALVLAIALLRSPLRYK